MKNNDRIENKYLYGETQFYNDDNKHFLEKNQVFQQLNNIKKRTINTFQSFCPKVNAEIFINSYIFVKQENKIKFYLEMSDKIRMRTIKLGDISKGTFLLTGFTSQYHVKGGKESHLLFYNTECKEQTDYICSLDLYYNILETNLGYNKFNKLKVNTNLLFTEKLEEQINVLFEKFWENSKFRHISTIYLNYFDFTINDNILYSFIDFLKEEGEYKENNIWLKFDLYQFLTKQLHQKNKVLINNPHLFTKIKK